jgi:hypothetical protein
MTELRTPVSEPELREQATIHLRKKRDFRAHYSRICSATAPF